MSKFKRALVEAPGALLSAHAGAASKLKGASDGLRSRLLRDLSIEMRELSSLKPNPHNARTHSKRQVKAIGDSIAAFGFTSPILIDDHDMIIAGHGRWQAAIQLGLDEVPTIRISALSEPQKRALILAENKLAERASWDRELLAIEVGELQTLLPDIGLAIDLTGFEIGEIDLLLLAGWQAQQKAIATQAEKIETQAAEIASLKQRLADIEAVLPKVTKHAAR